MEHCRDYFHQLSLDSGGPVLSPSVEQILQGYYAEASKFSVDNFSTLNDMVLSLESPQQLQHWNSVWHRCQQTKQRLEEILARATTGRDPGSADAKTPESSSSTTSSSSSGGGGGEGKPEQRGDDSCVLLPFEDGKPRSSEPFSKSPTSSISSSSHFVFPSDCDGKPGPSAFAFDDTDSDCTVDSSVSCHSEPTYTSTARLRKHPMKKIMKKTVSYELGARDGVHTDAGHVHGYTGVYIKGLEVTNNVSAEKKLQRKDGTSPALGRSRSMSTPSRVHGRHGDGESKKLSR